MVRGNREVPRLSISPSAVPWVFAATLLVRKSFVRKARNEDTSRFSNITYCARDFASYLPNLPRNFRLQANILFDEYTCGSM